MRDARPLSQQALELLQKRYLKQYEDWNALSRRVAKFAANTLEEEEEFYRLLSTRVLIPNTPCLVNAGTKDPQVSACFLLPIEDSLDSIFKTLADAAKIYQSAGGVGINFSPLRPEGFPLSRGGVSSGPISFLRIFNEMTEQVKQGSMRRGAGMALLQVDHPDIVKFIRCKNTEGTLANFNISVMITDKFMRQLVNAPNDTWYTKFNRTSYWIEKAIARPEHDGMWWDEAYPPRENDATAYTAKDIWDLICQQAWKNGEPGLVFIDTARKSDPDVDGCNPCGEVIMEPYEACVLASIDVSRFVGENIISDPYNFQELVDVAATGCLLLNRLVDKGKFPLDQIKYKVQTNRRIGLGIMGLADAMLMLGMRYGEKDSLEFASKIASTVTTAAKNFSQLQGFKNRTVACIAPTGSVSQIAGCSSGCEPVYDWVTKQTRQDFGEQTIKHPIAAQFKNLDSLPQYFVTALQISPEEHVRMQAALQSQIDGSISKTINLPHQATVDDIGDAYLMAYESNCKGITVYRDRSREVQVISQQTTPTESTKLTPQEETILDDADLPESDDTYWEAFLSEMGIPKTRPYCLEGFTFKIKLDMGGRLENTYITVTTVDNRPYEIFVYGNVRDADQIIAQYIDTVSRLISLSLRSGAPLDTVITQLRKVPCSHIFSIPHKIADILQEFLPGGPELNNTELSCQTSNIPTKTVLQQAYQQPSSVETCPSCFQVYCLTRSEGCLKCTVCGWSKCG